MKKISLVLATLLTASVSVSADTIKEAFENGKASGQLKAFYINRSYDWGSGFGKNPSQYTRDGLSVGGHLGYKTGKYYGFDAGATFYTTNKVDKKSENSYENDPTLFGQDGGGYSVLGEAYLGYTAGKTSVQFGQLSINTPFAAPNNFRMLPNTFEGLVIKNNDIKSLGFELGHINKIQTNGFANSVPVANGVLNPNSSLTRLSLIYGFGSGYKVGEFAKISDVYLGTTSTKSTMGMTYANINYTGVKGLTISIWDQYIHDIMNIVMAKVTYKTKLGSVKTLASAFYTKQNSAGDNLLGKSFAVGGVSKDVDSSQYGAILKAGLSNGLGLDLRYVNTPANEGTVLDGAIINALGGANPFIISQGALHANLGDTASYMVGVDYQLKQLTGLDLLAMVKYFQYNIGKYNGYQSGYSWKTQEVDLDFIYKVTKNFKLRARANFPKDWLNLGNSKNMSFSEYRLIAYYSF
ncbi:OprD family outer membrane porin [Sulfurimonas sp.]|uniref:OprD family outer membrane porin n=1 Tax=Sulfurimonas sp. TaxID=2022749 RepID=UPI002B494A37|nr:OprD family outer membrane porin [Sulfurimonas sp.]